MEGNLERGGANPPSCLTSEGWQVDRPAVAAHRSNPPSPPSTEGGSGGENLQRSLPGQQQKQQQSGPPHFTLPPRSRARGVQGGLTTQQQQQQQTSRPTVSTLAHHAFNLYRECVGAGQWAKVVFEQRPEGEHITFFIRPPTAAAAPPVAAAAKGRRQRRPNKNRLEKLKLRRHLRSQQQQQKPAQQQQEKSSSQPQQVLSRQQLKQVGSQLQAQSLAGLFSQQQPAAAARTRRTEPQPAAASRSSWQQRQPANVAGKAPAAAGTYAAVAAAPQSAAAMHSLEQLPQVQPMDAPQATATASSSSPAIISPRMTRAGKRKKALSPVDIACIVQLDGTESSPPPSPEVAARSAGPPEPAGPPPPPPWSKWFVKDTRTVICKYCQAGCHGLRFRSCSSCYDKGVVK